MMQRRVTLDGVDYFAEVTHMQRGVRKSATLVLTGPNDFRECVDVVETADGVGAFPETPTGPRHDLVCAITSRIRLSDCLKGG